MLIQEIVTINNRKFRRTYSSDLKYIQQVETGALFDEAYDIMTTNFTYIETDIPLSEDDIFRKSTNKFDDSL